MPTLIIQDGMDRRGGTFEWPLLIGSCPANAVMIADNSVAHVHAWIGSASKGFFVANVNKNGRTFVNGIPIQGRRLLSTGDLIQVGGTVKMTYYEEDALPKGVRPVAFPWRAPHATAPGEKQSLECGCGATIVMDVAPKPANGAAKAAPSQLISRAPEATPAPVRNIAPAPALVRVGAAVAPVTTAPVRTQPSPPAAAPAARVQPSVRPVRPASPLAGPALTVVVEPLELPEPTLEARLRATLPKIPPPVTEPAPAVVETLEPIDADPQAVVMKSDSGITESITATAPPVPVVAPPEAPVSATVDVVIPEVAPTLSGAVEEVAAVVASGDVESAKAQAAAEAVVETEVGMCAICQSRILLGEEMTGCPECGLTFHADCWTENRGCAAYGCAQVGVLEPPDATPVKQVDESEFVDPFPWEFLLLGASVISVVAGALAFGALSAALGLATIWVGIRKGLRRWPLLAASCAMCVFGVVVGLEFSKFWWLGWKPFEWLGP
jgi:pSer/pThr/pTyr-binding forkhead associated (FHA) protein